MNYNQLKRDQHRSVDRRDLSSEKLYEVQINYDS